MESKQSNEIHRKHTRKKKNANPFSTFIAKQTASQPTKHASRNRAQTQYYGRLNVAQRQRELENLQTICV